MNLFVAAACHGIRLLRLQDRHDLAVFTFLCIRYVGKDDRLHRLIAVDPITKDIYHVMVIGKVESIIHHRRRHSKRIAVFLL